MLTAFKKVKPTILKFIPMKKKVAVLQNAKTYFEKKAGIYAKLKLIFTNKKQVSLQAGRKVVKFCKSVISMPGPASYA
jgi:hypothetical protein